MGIVQDKKKCGILLGITNAGVSLALVLGIGLVKAIPNCCGTSFA